MSFCISFYFDRESQTVCPVRSTKYRKRRKTENTKNSMTFFSLSFFYFDSEIWSTLAESDEKREGIDNLMIDREKHRKRYFIV